MPIEVRMTHWTILWCVLSTAFAFAGIMPGQTLAHILSPYICANIHMHECAQASTRSKWGKHSATCARPAGRPPRRGLVHRAGPAIGEHFRYYQQFALALAMALVAMAPLTLTLKLTLKLTLTLMLK